MGVAVLSAVMMNAPGLARGCALLACAVCAPLLAWPGVPRRLRVRMVTAGSFLSLGVTGLMRLMSSWGLPPPVMILLGCLVLRLIPVAAPHPADAPRLAAVDIRHGAHHLTLTALIDSGNLLRDAVTGLPVIVISRRAAQRLVQLPQEGKLTYPFRLMGVRTVSGTGMMVIFHPDSVYIQTPEGWQRVETLLGVSPDGYEGFQALVPVRLISDAAALSV